MLHEVGRTVRGEVAPRARYNCEYCLIREEDSGFSHQIDHIVSLKHGGGSALSNLAYACVPWVDHFRLKGSAVEPCTEIGAATIRLLRLNAPERIVERRILQDLGYYPPR